MNRILKDKKIIISTLWIFAVLNYFYCDRVWQLDGDLFNQYLTGKVESIEMNQIFLFAGSILMEISISMVLLSKILPYEANKIINIGAAAIITVAQTASVFLLKITIYYLFFSVIEIVATISIFIIAMKWKYKE